MKYPKHLRLASIVAATLLCASASAHDHELRYAKPVDPAPVYPGVSYDQINVSHYRLDLDTLAGNARFEGWGVDLQKRVNANWYVQASHVDGEFDQDSDIGIDRTLMGIGHIVNMPQNMTLDVGAKLGRVRLDGEKVDTVEFSVGVRQRVERVDWRIVSSYSDYDHDSMSSGEFSVLVGADYFIDEKISLGAQATLSSDYKLFGLGASYHF